MSERLTTKKLVGTRVVDAKRGKRIGKVYRFVFHPSERRCVGFTVKRPDAALMFHRKDLFVALSGFQLVDGQIVVADDPRASGPSAIQALGLNWDACVIWVGMPVVTQSGDELGYIDAVVFDRETGAVHSLTTENGAANDVILGKRSIPANLVLGFRRNEAAVRHAGEITDENWDEVVEEGAIMVSDKALDLPVHGGVAAAAGKASAVAADRARKGAAKAKAAAAETAEKARPTVQRAAEKADEAVSAGSFALGKQLGRTTGMFSAFKEEFEKAAKGGED